MNEDNLIQIQKQIRSPRSAALAGILFSVLLIASMLLVTGTTQVSPAEINTEWIETRSSPVSLALGFVPYAGIAFFWFTGVIRDHIGDREDRFFATVFLGSGIAFVVLIFIWAATTGAVFGSFSLAADLLTSKDIFIFGLMFRNEILGNYILRIAGVDILDRTPLLDIKPYAPYFDHYDVEHCGWLDRADRNRRLADNRFED